MYARVHSHTNASEVQQPKLGDEKARDGIVAGTTRPHTSVQETLYATTTTTTTPATNRQHVECALAAPATVTRA
jgi:hypothetical protein